MQNRNSPSGSVELRTVRFGCSALQAAGTPQTELFAAGDDPETANVGVVDTGSAYLATGVSVIGRAQLKALTVRNRVVGTASMTYAVQRVPSTDLSTRTPIPLNAAGDLSVTVDSTITDPQRFVVPLTADVGFEDGDLIVLTATHGSITGPTSIDVQVELQPLPNATLFDGAS